jgi:ABC-type multidrug transport system ATPase subunit/pSer/pThr/pTyr-binding forkhead associated (FHA) protein
MFGVFTIHSRDRTEELPVTKAVVNVGRAADNDLNLPYATVSLHHARILADAFGCGVMDLGSSNGTRLNGVEIPVKVAQTLSEGDLVEIGPFQLRFRASQGHAAAPADARPSAPAVAPAAAQPGGGRTVILPPDLPARLVVSTPGGTRVFPLKKDSVTLGREGDNDIVVEAEAVSRHHAVLKRRGPAFLITDLGSTNGLNVAGEPVKEKLLKPGDYVCIGHSVTLEYLGAEALAADMAAAAVAPAGMGGPGPAVFGAPGAPAQPVYEIREGDSLVLGRGAQTGVHMAHPQVSVEHAEVQRQADQYVIRDMGSSGGTYVNGQLVSRQALRENDVIRIGPNQLVFEAGSLRLMSQEGSLRLDAFHLSKVVGKGRKRQRILRDVSLSVKPQEFVAVVGGSGAGKSTLVNALCGFKPATEGAVLLNGVDLYGNFDAYRNEMGYVPQDDIIHLDLPVSKALDYAARLRMPADTSRNEREQRVNEVIDELDLKACASRTVRQLSGGQRKRVSIGVELLTRPSLFFLDEATSGLDPGTESAMMKLLRKLADQGRTIILITHATKNVMVCDKVVFLVRGGLLAYFGPPEDALTYFGVKEFDEIYERLESGASPEEWAQRYLTSPELQEYVVRPLSEVAGARSGPYAGGFGGGYGAGAQAPGGTASPGARLRRTSSWNQFLTLSARYLDIMRRDKKTLLLLLAISPVLGLLDGVTSKRDLFDPVRGSASKAVQMLFMASIIGILVGTITSVREIVKEDAIYRREHMVSVRIFPYVASKVAVGSIFALYSAVVLYLFKIGFVDFGHLGPISHAELLFSFVLVTFSGLMWGLLVSAIAPTEDRAMLLVILVLVPQFIFAGGMDPVSELGVAGTIFGAVTSSRWALGAMATIAEIKTGAGKMADMSDTFLPGIKGLRTTEEKVAMVQALNRQFGAILDVNVAFYWGMCIVLIAALLGLIVLLQKRKDIL